MEENTNTLGNVVGKKDKKTFKTILIVLFGILILLLIIFVVVFFVFLPNSEEIPLEVEHSEEILIEQEQEEELVKAIEIIKDDGTRIVISNLPLMDSSGGYASLLESEHSKSWVEISDYTSNLFIEYFVNEDALFNLESPQKEEIDGETYYYLFRRDDDGTGFAGVGTVWNRANSIDIFGYKAYQVISYYNPVSEGEPISGEFLGMAEYSEYKIDCLFDFSYIDENIEGYLLLSHHGPFGTFNVCEKIDENFSISIISDL